MPISTLLLELLLLALNCSRLELFSLGATSTRRRLRALREANGRPTTQAQELPITALSRSSRRFGP